MHLPFSAPHRSRSIASDPVARQVAAEAHGGLLVLERGLNDRGVLRTVITVDETRETISFFGSTAAVEGWRVCIVDTVDELNPNAANALLKILEEPPQQSLFLLVSHATVAGAADHPVALPQTAAAARSRPRTSFAPRPRASDRPADDPALVEAAAASEGSVARALTLLGGDALKLQQRTAALLATLPQVDPRELHALGDSAWHQRPRRAGRLHRRRRPLDLPSACTPMRPMPMRTCRALHGWRRYGKRSPAPRATPKSINLERKPLVFSVFSQLAEATR